MADELTANVSEVLPGRVDEISGVGSANAPFIYTDWIGAKGINSGVVSITLEASRLMAVGNKLTRDRVVVAHLRMSLQSMRVLRAVLDEVELLAQPPASNEKQ